MKQHIADYVKQFDHRLVSPIWGGEKAFHFLCLGHLEMSEALGFKTEQVTPVLRQVIPGQLETEEQLAKLLRENRIDDSYVENELNMFPRMRRDGKGNLCGGGCFGPLTVASNILGIENLLKMVVRNPGYVDKVTGYIAEFIMEIARRECEKGQDLFWIAEPLASLVSPEIFWRFSGQYLKRIYETAQAPGFLHVCGQTIKHTPYLAKTGAEVLSVDYCTDIGKCIRMVDDHVVIMGNINPSTLRFGTREEVAQEVQMVLDACEGFSNFVLSTGCAIMEGTPDENMMVMFEKCKS